MAHLNLTLGKPCRKARARRRDAAKAEEVACAPPSSSLDPATLATHLSPMFAYGAYHSYNNAMLLANSAALARLPGGDGRPIRPLARKSPAAAEPEHVATVSHPPPLADATVLHGMPYPVLNYAGGAVYPSPLLFHPAAMGLLSAHTR